MFGHSLTKSGGQTMTVVSVSDPGSTSHIVFFLKVCAFSLKFFTLMTFEILFLFGKHLHVLLLLQLIDKWGGVRVNI